MFRGRTLATRLTVQQDSQPAKNSRRSCKCYFTLAEFKMAPTCSGKTHMRFTLSSRWYPEFKMVPTRSRKTHMRSTLSSRWYPEFKMVPPRSRKPTRAPPHLVSPEQALKQFECWSVTGYGPFSSSQERSSTASCFTSRQGSMV